MTIPTPSIEYGLLSPMLIVLGSAVLGVLIEAFVPRRLRYQVQIGVSLAALLAALVAVVVLAGHLGDGNGATAMLGAVAVDRPPAPGRPRRHRAILICLRRAHRISCICYR